MVTHNTFSHLLLLVSNASQIVLVLSAEVLSYKFCFHPMELKPVEFSLWVSVH